MSKNKIIYTSLPLGVIGILVPVVLFLFLQKAYNLEGRKFAWAASQTVSRIFFQEAKRANHEIKSCREILSGNQLDRTKVEFKGTDYAILKQSLGEDLFGFSRIDSLVDADLSEQGIQTEYNYVFSITRLKIGEDETYCDIVGGDAPIESMELYRKGDVDPRGLKHTFYYFEKDDYIEIMLHSYFPARQQVILSRMSAEIVIALILCLVAILLIWLTLKNLSRQKRLSDMKSDFINNISHEFNTPLSTITLVSDLLEKRNGDPDFVKTNVSIIKRQSTRLKKMFNNAMDLSLFSNSERAIKLQTQSVHHLIDLCAEEYLLKHKELIVNRHYTRDSDFVPVDEFYLTTVINNLIDNAFKYSGKERVEVFVETARENRDFVIRFNDNGDGVSKSDSDMLFEKFYRGTTGKGNTKGLGIGLHLVKCAVQAHNGNILVDKNCKSGLGFVIKIPIENKTNEKA